jgi:hypothetical protein
MFKMPQYKFVAVQGGDCKASKLTRGIRSHAIRAGLARTTRPSMATASPQYSRSRRSKDNSALCLAQNEEDVPQRDCLDAGAEPMTLECANTDADAMATASSAQCYTWRRASVGSGCVDPFNSLPVSSNAEVDYLIRYCKSSTC